MSFLFSCAVLFWRHITDAAIPLLVLVRRDHGGRLVRELHSAVRRGDGGRRRARIDRDASRTASRLPTLTTARTVPKVRHGWRHRLVEVHCNNFVVGFQQVDAVTGAVTEAADFRQSDDNEEKQEATTASQSTPDNETGQNAIGRVRNSQMLAFDTVESVLAAAVRYGGARLVAGTIVLARVVRAVVSPRAVHVCEPRSADARERAATQVDARSAVLTRSVVVTHVGGTGWQREECQCDACQQQ